MKNKTQKQTPVSLLRILTLTLLMLSTQFINAQGFNLRHGLTSNNHDAESWEMVTCQAVSGVSYDYVSFNSRVVGSVEQLIGVRMLDDGTMFNINFHYIQHTNDSFHFRPLKVIPLINNSGYAITGYVTKVIDPTRPFPFVMVVNTSLVVQSFKRFKINGFFCDIDELSNGDFLFCGSRGSGLNDTSTGRKGLIVRTSSSFTPSYMREINLFTPGAGLHQFFDIINDAILIDDDTAIVCGNVTEQCGILANTKSRTLLAKINVNTGVFVWHRTHFNETKLAVRLAIKSDEITMAINGGSAAPILAFYDRGGNFKNARSISFNSASFNMVINNGTSQLISFNPLGFIQNIYYRSDDKIFVSGKFLHVNYYSNNHADMPFSLVYDNSNQTTSNKYLYKTTHEYPSFVNFLSYKNFNFVSTCSGSPNYYSPIAACGNTVPRVSGTNEFVTMTHDMGKVGVASFYLFKELGFTNDNSMIMCGVYELSTSTSDVDKITHVDATNSSVTAPVVLSPVSSENDGGWTSFNCQQ